MRVLSWNMNKREGAWDYLMRNAETFDVALLQETRDPRVFGGEWSSTAWRPMSGEPGSRRARWGTAIVAPRLQLQPYNSFSDFPWLDALGGAATIVRSQHAPMWFASVHFHSSRVPDRLLDTIAWDGVPLSTPNHSVWETDLIPYELHRLFEGDTFLWGGDLNSAESMDGNPSFVGGNRQLRSTWRAAGSHDLRLRFQAEEQQTFFRPRRKPYQLDHVFADARTEARVTAWQVDLEPVPELSDHAPVVVDLA